MFQTDFGGFTEGCVAGKDSSPTLTVEELATKYNVTYKKLE